MKKLIALIYCIISISACLISCSYENTTYESVIKTMKNGPYYLEFEIMAENHKATGSLAKKDDSYYLLIDNSALLLTPDKSYAIDHETKKYWDDYSTDFNYTFFDVLLNLKVK